jgi:hypothetical protein
VPFVFLVRVAAFALTRSFITMFQRFTKMFIKSFFPVFSFSNIGLAPYVRVWNFFVR